MTRLANLLKRLREQSDRSIRWVERKSKDLYPDERDRQISHNYLRQIEEGIQSTPSPGKLQTLAEIYEIDHEDLMVAAGYIEEDEDNADLVQDLSRHSDGAKADLAQKMIESLEKKGIRPEFFMNAVVNLTEESAKIVYRLVTTLSIQGQASVKVKPATKKKKQGSP